MRPQGSRLPVAPLLCLEQLEERRLLNGAPSWAAALAGASHDVAARITGHHASADPGQASTGATLGDLKHNAFHLHIFVKQIGPDSASSETGPHVAHASHMHTHGRHATARADDPEPSPTTQLSAVCVSDKEHGKPKTRENHDSPTAQLIAALKHDRDDGANPASAKNEPGLGKGPRAVGNPDDNSSHGGSDSYPTADGNSQSAPHPVASNANGGDNSPWAPPPSADSGDDSGGSSNAGSSKSGGSTDTGNGKSGKGQGASGSGGSHSNGNGNGGSRTGNHKGSGKSGGSQGSTHGGGGHGGGSPSGVPIGPSAEPDLGTTSSDPVAVDNTATSASDAVDGARGLAVLLANADNNGIDARTGTLAGDGVHGNSAAEPHGAAVGVKLDGSADVTDSARSAAHHSSNAQPTGDLELRTQTVSERTESSELAALSAEVFEWLVNAEGADADILPHVGVPEGTTTPAELIALGVYETQVAMRELLAQLAQLSQQTAGALAGHALAPWLIAAAAGAAAAEVARRRLRRGPAEPVLAGAGQASSSTWFPGLPE